MNSKSSIWFRLFWMFLKVNLLSTSGPASVGLLYKEAVGKVMTEDEFVEAVGFSSVLPGSDALQLALFVGYAAGGILGASIALFGSILPPTLLMLGLASLLQQFQGEAWMNGFVGGLAPAVAMLMVIVAWQVFRGEKATNNTLKNPALLIAGISLVALILGIPSPLVLISAGVIGVILFR